MTETIKVQRIEICDEAGTPHVTLSAGKNLGGLWIENKSGHMLAIWTDNDRAAIGVYAPGNRQACDASVSVDLAGNVYLQRRCADGTFQVREFRPEAPTLQKTSDAPPTQAQAP